MAHNLLTARSVEAKKARGRYSDGGGLVLQVSKWGTKSWAFRYQRGDRDRHMGLGPLHTLSLADARERARECRQLLLAGRDPIEERKARRQSQRLETARSMTFRDCAEAYVTAHAAGWRNEKHRAQWSSTLARYAYPAIGELPVSAIDTSLVLKCLEPIWQLRPETAKRVRGRIESILGWAAVRDFRRGDNPARWRGHLDQLLPAPGKVRAVRHHPALPYAELPQFMAELRQRDDVAARALELTILTALRTGELIGGHRDEIDLATKLWTIPAVRMKGRREHRVPLSKRALEILSVLPNGRLVFPGGRKNRPLSNMAMLKLLERMGRDDVTVHGFRSTFRDWAAETTGYPNHVVEMALAHIIGDEVEAAYRRGDLLEKRRRLMEDWARYCMRPAAGGDVVALRG
jgi:integrase